MSRKGRTLKVLSSVNNISFRWQASRPSPELVAVVHTIVLGLKHAIQAQPSASEGIDGMAEAFPRACEQVRCELMGGGPLPLEYASSITLVKGKKRQFFESDWHPDFERAIKQLRVLEELQREGGTKAAQDRWEKSRLESASSPCSVLSRSEAGKFRDALLRRARAHPKRRRLACKSAPTRLEVCPTSRFQAVSASSTRIHRAHRPAALAEARGSVRPEGSLPVWMEKCLRNAKVPQSDWQGVWQAVVQHRSIELGGRIALKDVLKQRRAGQSL